MSRDLAAEIAALAERARVQFRASETNDGDMDDRTDAFVMMERAWRAERLLREGDAADFDCERTGGPSWDDGDRFRAQAQALLEEVS